MKRILLLTQDSSLQTLVARALAADDGTILVARDAAEALQMICARDREFDYAVIDFAEGCRGMTLLSAIDVCQPALPVIAITSGDAYDVAAVAYANGVEVCLTRPIRAGDLQIAIQELAEPKRELEAA